MICIQIIFVIFRFIVKELRVVGSGSRENKRTQPTDTLCNFIQMTRRSRKHFSDPAFTKWWFTAPDDGMGFT